MSDTEIILTLAGWAGLTLSFRWGYWAGQTRAEEVYRPDRRKNDRNQLVWTEATRERTRMLDSHAMAKYGAYHPYTE